MLLSVIGTAAVASALASAHTATAPADTRLVIRETVVEKNSPFPVLGPLVVEECVKDDCSDLAG
jgi:hypothetical protein